MILNWPCHPEEYQRGRNYAVLPPARNAAPCPGATCESVAQEMLSPMPVCRFGSNDCEVGYNQAVQYLECSSCYAWNGEHGSVDREMLSAECSDHSF
eukprot:1139444-Pyramimonas_sp.AAC.1